MGQVYNPQPTNMESMFSSPSAMLGDIAASQANNYNTNNQLNQAGSLQDMYIQQQKLPYELQDMGLVNQQTAAGIPGVQARSGLSQNELDISNASLPQQRQAAISKALANTSDSDLVQSINAIHQGMIDPSPTVRNASEYMYQNLPDSAMLRYKNILDQNKELAVVGAQGENQRALETQQYEHGKYLKPGTMTQAMRFNTLTDPLAIQTVGTQLLADPAVANDPEVSASITKRLQANAPLYNNAMQAKMGAEQGKVNAAQLTGMPGVQAPTAPVLGGQPQVPQQPASQSQVTQEDQTAYQWALANPNDPRAAKIIAHITQLVQPKGQ